MLCPMVSDDVAGARPAADEPRWEVGAGNVSHSVVLAAFAAACGPFEPRWILVGAIAVPVGVIGAVWARRLQGSRRLSIVTTIVFLPVFLFADAIEFDGSPGRGLIARLVVAVLAALLVLTPVTVAAVAGRRR
jgi:hypothetical protein